MTDRSVNEKNMSPRSLELSEQMKDRSRSKILDAALDLFGHNGYYGTSMDKIAKKAGVSKGLIYTHFSSKEELLKGIMEHAMAGGEEDLPDLSNPNSKLLLKELIQTTFRMLISNKSEYKLLHGLSLQVGEMSFIQEMAVGKYDFYMALLDRIFKDLDYPNEHEMSIELAAILDGVGMQYLMLENEAILKEMENLLIKKYKL